MSPAKLLKESFLELKKPSSLAVTAMLLALCVVLGIFGNFTLAVFGNMVKIKFTFLPIAVAGALFGPVPAVLVGALGDVLAFILAPSGAYIPGFTVSAALTGLIYGCFFCQNRITLPRVIVAWCVNALTVETFLAALWFYLFMNPGYDTPYTVFLTARWISVAIKCVPEILLLYGAGALVCTAEKRLRR